ncbi:hypothetical protein [Devosia sp. CAU 1758]
MKPQKSTPAPLETDHGEQQDDNIDEFGHRPDGTEQDQPISPGPKSDAPAETEDNPDR